LLQIQQIGSVEIKNFFIAMDRNKFLDL